MKHNSLKCPLTRSEQIRLNKGKQRWVNKGYGLVTIQLQDQKQSKKLLREKQQQERERRKRKLNTAA